MGEYPLVLRQISLMKVVISPGVDEIEQNVVDSSEYSSPNILLFDLMRSSV
jgi:hypothetical protein